MRICLPMIAAGAVITWLGRHSVLGIAIGCGMMFVGWVITEATEQRSR